MKEQSAWAELTSVTLAIQKIKWSEMACMYLELVPLRLIKAQEQHEGIRLERYNATTAFDSWQRGRVFDAACELKWEWRNNVFHTVYCGPEPPTEFTIVPLQAARTQETAYYLWGKRVRDSDLQTLGLSPKDYVFVELQAPHILRYPVSQSAQRVKVAVREWYASDGSLCYARWCKLEEEPTHEPI